MHIPDGFLDARTAAATAGIAAGGVGWAVRRVRANLPSRKVPLLGLTAAFVFAAQMINFPVAGGTSGHLLGGVLAAVLLGPSAGVLVLASVLVVQCFLFADGGLLSLGANIVNMGLCGGAGGYAVYRAFCSVARGPRGRLAAAFFASWCSVVFASMACAAELALSGAVRWSVGFPAMTGVHMLIGVGEAAITVLVLSAVSAARPELLRDETHGRAPERARSGAHDPGLVVSGLLVALGLALFIAPHASSWPDGLERVAHDLGFMRRASARAAPAEGYAFPGFSSPVAATAAAGAAGTILVFVTGFFMARLLMPRRVAAAPEREGPRDHAPRLP